MIIGNRHIAPHSPVLVIAELGVNHDGSVERALHLVKIAKRCGADAVKLQVFQANQLMHESSQFAEYQKHTVLDSDPVAMLKRYELDEISLKKIVDTIHAAGMLAVATPFSPGDVGTIDRIGVDVIKVASPDAVNRLLLQRVAQLGRPIIVSTGASTLDEIHMCCDWLRGWKASFSLLHCISSYPAPAESTNLCWIRELQQECGVTVGFSDHSTEVVSGALAVAAGATIVERHLTYAHNADGPDHAASSDPGEFSHYVRLVRQAEKMIGSPGKRVLAIEQDVRQVSRQSLVCCRDLRAGEMIGPDDLTVQRPGTGIPAAMIENTVGKIIRRAVKAGSMLQWDMLGEAA